MPGVRTGFPKGHQSHAGSRQTTSFQSLCLVSTGCLAAPAGAEEPPLASRRCHGALPAIHKPRPLAHCTIATWSPNLQVGSDSWLTSYSYSHRLSHCDRLLRLSTAQLYAPAPCPRLHTRPAPSCLHTVTGHGGAGIIFSVGLLRMISAKDALAYIMKQKGCGGGDCLLSRWAAVQLCGSVLQGPPVLAGCRRSGVVPKGW